MHVGQKCIGRNIGSPILKYFVRKIEYDNFCLYISLSFLDITDAEDRSGILYDDHFLAPCDIFFHFSVVRWGSPKKLSGVNNDGAHRIFVGCRRGAKF